MNRLEIELWSTNWNISIFCVILHSIVATCWWTQSLPPHIISVLLTAKVNCCSIDQLIWAIQRISWSLQCAAVEKNIGQRTYCCCYWTPCRSANRRSSDRCSLSTWWGHVFSSHCLQDCSATFRFSTQWKATRFPVQTTCSLLAIYTGVAASTGRATDCVSRMLVFVLVACFGILL